MSLDTWKEEFYPTAAFRCSREDALEHTLLKWTGLLPRNRKKHGCSLRSQAICDDDDFLDIDASTCALCQYHRGSVASLCDGCPLRCCFAVGRPYDKFYVSHAVAPMVTCIKAAIKKASK